MELRMAAERIRTCMKRTAEDIVAVGREMQSAQARLAKTGKDGQFSAWLRTEFEMSRTTAYRLISVAERVGNHPSLGQLPVSTLYLLAEAPAEVREAVKSGAVPATSEAIRAAREDARKAREDAEQVRPNMMTRTRGRDVGQLQGRGNISP